jgi:hypothetical protein
LAEPRVRDAFSVRIILVLILVVGTALLIPSPAEGAATWYVDGTLGTDDGVHGTGPGINAFKTIQYAINDVRVVDSDIINVAAGTYNEDIQINKGLTIQSSSGAADTIIRGSGAGSSYYMIRIYHSDVTFDGFTVTNPDYQGGADACGILVGNYLGESVNNIRILNNIVKEVRDGTGGPPSSYGATGINIGSGTPSNIIISGNVIEHVHNPDGASNDHTCGINVWDNGNVIEISNNRISDIKYNGILLQYANNIQVTSNAITQCQVGVKIDPYTGAVVSGATIDHNIIVENSDYGVDNHDPNLVNAINNWWGCNDGPGIVGPGSGDKVSSNITYDPWLVLNLCANPTSIPADGISTAIIIADMNKNSDGQDTLVQGHIPDGTQIIFTTDKGSITSPTITTSGIANTVFTSDTTPSQAKISARAPTSYTCATASIFVNMHAPLPPVDGDVGISPCEWTEYSNNPVFGQWLGYANRAYYPKVLYDASQFSGHGESAYYKMWFNSDNGMGGGYSIGYAYSDNGTNWTEVMNPVNGLAQHPGHPLVEYDPDGFGHSVYYKMWYWDEGASIYTIDTLRYAESNDGINWSNDQPLTQDDMFKLVTGLGTGWNRGSYGPCDLVYNSSGSSSIDDCNIWNNKYVMYYMGTDGGNEFIGLAYSDNGTHWKRYGNDPVLSPGAAGDWDNTGVGYCTVMNISGIWQMWYGGGPNTNQGVGYAISSDGVNWTKHPDNPIFHISDGMLWRNERTYTPWVVYDASSFSGHGDDYPYKMWFSGKSTTGKYSVGYAYAIPVDAGPDQEVCQDGNPIPLTGASPPGGYWSGTGVLGSDFDPSGLLPGPYTVIYTYTNIKGCSSSDNKTVTINAKPTANILSNSPVCIGNTIQLTGGPDGMASYSWTGPGGWTSNQQSPSRSNATLTMAGTYILTVSNGACSDNAAVTVSVTACSNVNAGGGGGLPASHPTTLTLTVNMQGEITTVGMTRDGVLSSTCLAKDSSGNHTLQLNKGAKLTLADNTAPLLLRFRETSTKPPTPENTVIIGPVYELNAYSSPYAITPSPITISPPARLTLNYEPDELPKNTAEVFIANYHAEKGWLALASPEGITAEAGKANAELSNLSLFAVLAKIAEPSARSTVSNLTVSPSQAQLNQEVTISVDVANTGDTALDYNMQLKVDGRVKSSKLVTIAAGASQTVKFTVNGDTVGKHQVELAGLNGEFEVVGLNESEVAGQSQINWWLIGGIVGAILLIIIGIVVRRRQLRGY